MLAIIVAFFAIGILNWWDKPTIWYGYVASCDQRIHSINLETGKLVWSSNEFEWMANPMGIDIDRERSVLYIASGSYLSRRNFIPLAAIKLNDASDIVFSSYLYSNSTEFPSATETGVRLNAELNLLYVGHLGANELLTVLDSRTGEIVGGLDIPMSHHYEISPDGTAVSDIFPSGSDMIGDTSREWRGGVSTWNLLTGEKVSFMELDENKGLTPPWGSPEENFYFVSFSYEDYTSTLQVYNRQSGELLAAHHLPTTFKFGSGGSQTHVTRIPGRSDVAMSIGDSVVVFDPLTAEIKARTIIPGESCFSNVVVTDKPLIRAE